jgi:hypothetical protein
MGLPAISIVNFYKHAGPLGLKANQIPVESCCMS